MTITNKVFTKPFPNVFQKVFGEQEASSEGGPTSPFLIDEDFTVDPVWTEVGTVSVTGGEAVSTTSGGSEDYLENIFGDETELWAQSDFNADTGYTIATGGQQSSVFGLLDGGTPLIALQLYNNFGTFEFRAIYRGDGANNASTIATPLPTLAQEFSILLHLKQNSGVDVTDGIREIWIDSTKVLDISNLDDDTRLADRFRIGNFTTGTTPSGTTRFDNLQISTTGSAR